MRFIQSQRNGKSSKIPSGSSDIICRPEETKVFYFMFWTSCVKFVLVASNACQVLIFRDDLAREIQDAKETEGRKRKDRIVGREGIMTVEEGR